MLTIWMNSFAHAGGIDTPTQAQPPVAKADALPLDPAPARRQRRNIVGWLIGRLGDRVRVPAKDALAGSTAGA